MNTDEYQKSFDGRNTPEVVVLSPSRYIVMETNVLAETGDAMLSVKALYAISEAMKASLGQQDSEEYPLEGVWKLISKEIGFVEHTNIIGNFMLKQSDSVDAENFRKHKEALLESSRDQDFFEHLKGASFRVLDQGTYVKMRHVGPYTKEQGTFDIMEQFAAALGLKRLSDAHRESYIKDVRTVGPEKFETILKFEVVERMGDRTWDSSPSSVAGK